MENRYPVCDDHIHLDPVNGRGCDAARDFQRAGGTHLFLVSKPSWSYGIAPVCGSDFTQAFDATLAVAGEVGETGIVVFPVLGVHPAEITRLTGRMPLAEAVEVMKGGLDLAADYVREGRCVAIKSGRPHYPVADDIRDASNDVLAHALRLGAECGCAVQLHAESGPCADVVEMAWREGISPAHIVKHFATPDTPLTPSFIAKLDAIPDLCREKRIFTMESDFMDENSRPGAVLGPKSVPRLTKKLLLEGRIGEEDVFRIHQESPSRTYGVEIEI